MRKVGKIAADGHQTLVLAGAAPFPQRGNSFSAVNSTESPHLPTDIFVLIIVQWQWKISINPGFIIRLGRLSKVLETHCILYQWLEYKKEELDAAIKNSDFDILKQQEQAEGFNEKPINATTFFRKGGKFDWVNHIKMEKAEGFLKKNENIFQMYYKEKTGNW